MSALPGAKWGGALAMQLKHLGILCTAFAAGSFLLSSAATAAQLVANPTNKPDCMNNTAFFDPKAQPMIDLPEGFKASVFASGLNAPTGIAFVGDANNFQV